VRKLADFHARYQGNALVIDKWFNLQAGSLHPHVLDQVKALATHPDFTISNPNRVRALYMALANNPSGFHDAGGEGYRMIGDLIIALDPINARRRRGLSPRWAGGAGWSRCAAP
jgi:aminopeptidase N